MTDKDGAVTGMKPQHRLTCAAWGLYSPHSRQPFSYAVTTRHTLCKFFLVTTLAHAGMLERPCN